MKQILSTTGLQQSIFKARNKVPLPPNIVILNQELSNVLDCASAIRIGINLINQFSCHREELSKVGVATAFTDSTSSKEDFRDNYTNTMSERCLVILAFPIKSIPHYT